MSKSREQRISIEAKIINVDRLGWAMAEITRTYLSNAETKTGDLVTIPKRFRVKKGDNVVGKVVRNKKAGSIIKWFAIFCEAKQFSTKKVDWKPWQVGENALVLSLPSTKPGSDHRGINLACCKCGQEIVKSDQIYRIKNTCIWTKTIPQHLGMVVDLKKDYNENKNCNVQKVRCVGCKNILGSYYCDPYDDCVEGQEFPCFKLITAWERRKWVGNNPTMAMVLLGDKTTTEQSIANLGVSDEWEVEKEFQVGGRIDKSTYALMEKAKNAIQAQEEAEKRLKEAEQNAAAAKAAEEEASRHIKKIESLAEETEKKAERRAKEAEKAAAMAKAAEEEASKRAQEMESLAAEKEKRAEEVEKRFAEARATSSMSTRIIWNYTVDFIAMCQRNINTNVFRQVRRREEKVNTGQLVKWECKVENDWILYPPAISENLESNYQQNITARFTLVNKIYEVDFQSKEMKQANIETGFKRQVRRRVVIKDAARHALPDTWTPNAHGQNCAFVPVSNSTTEWQDVEANLTKTLPNVKLQQILRVQNIPLWEYFCFRNGQITKLSGDPNVISVWHGTRKTDPEIICKDERDGFMMQHSRRDGMWGQGIYFAKKASYSDAYAYKEKRTRAVSNFFGFQSRTHIEFHKTLILAKLVAGEEKDLPPDSALRLCPEKPGGKGKYDTVTGTTQGSKVYIVYENGRAYPEYLVTYTY